MKARHKALPAVVALAALAGCGSDSGDSQPSNGVESKSAEQILDEAAAALGRVQSFHMEGSQGSTVIKADVALPGKLRLALKDKAEAASILVVNGSFYMKANADFWDEQGQTADELADRWFKLPAGAKELKDLTDGLDAATLSHCLPKDHGTLTKGGTATVDGQPAVVIVDKGDRPGSAPGKLYVATEGEPLPLRATATGKQRPGGTKDPRCEEDSGDSEAKSNITFSDYNEPLDVKAPPSAVDLAGGTAS